MFKLRIVKMALASAIFLLPFSVSAEMVNINEASAAAISHHLSGIGEKKAGSIVAYRELNGKFESLDDIVQVKGIGQGLLKKNRDDLSLSEGVVKLLDKKVSSKVVVIDATKKVVAKIDKQNYKKVVSKAESNKIVKGVKK